VSLDLGIVTAVHPGDRSIDVVMVRDASRVAGVLVLGEMITDRSGRTDLHETGTPSDGDQWSVTALRDQQQIVAVIGYVGGRNPVCMGFLPQQVVQMTFDRLNFRVDRHPSDVYETLDNAGNYEWHHPSGSFIRIAEDPNHEDLTGQDVDGRWKLDRNAQRAPWLSVHLKNAGTEVAKLTIDPSGNVVYDHNGNLDGHTAGAATINIDGNATVEVGGNLAATVSGSTSLNSTGNVDVTAPLSTVHGPLTVTGKITGQAGMAISGGGGATVAGNVAVTGGNVTADGVGLKTHTHGDPQGGTTTAGSG
jgi:phage gp45-like